MRVIKPLLIVVFAAILAACTPYRHGTASMPPAPSTHPDGGKATPQPGVLELTYNYGIDSYEFGNDLQYICLSTKVSDVPFFLISSFLISLSLYLGSMWREGLMPPEPSPRSRA